MKRFQALSRLGLNCNVSPCTMGKQHALSIDPSTDKVEVYAAWVVGPALTMTQLLASHVTGSITRETWRV